MDAQLTAKQLAEVVTYQGSGEHKRYPNLLCHPALRTDASDCDAVDPSLSQDPERLGRLLRSTFLRGQYDRVREGIYPRYAWGWLSTRDGNKELFEVRLTNSAQGAYKGYFITMEDLIGKKAWARRNLDIGGAWSEVIE